MSKSLIMLPRPRMRGRATFEATLARHAPVSPYAEEEMKDEQIGQLLWAAHAGLVKKRNDTADGGRCLMLYTCRSDGVWRYHPQEHCLTRHLGTDIRSELANASRNRCFIAQAPCVLAVVGFLRATEEDANDHWSLRHSAIEIGRAIERARLQAVAMGLAGTPTSVFDRQRAAEAMFLSSRLSERTFLAKRCPTRTRFSAETWSSRPTYAPKSRENRDRHFLSDKLLDRRNSSACCQLALRNLANLPPKDCAKSSISLARTWTTPCGLGTRTDGPSCVVICVCLLKCPFISVSWTSVVERAVFCRAESASKSVLLPGPGLAR